MTTRKNTWLHRLLFPPSEGKRWLISILVVFTIEVPILVFTLRSTTFPVSSVLTGFLGGLSWALLYMYYISVPGKRKAKEDIRLETSERLRFTLMDMAVAVHRFMRGQEAITGDLDRKQIVEMMSTYIDTRFPYIPDSEGGISL